MMILGFACIIAYDRVSDIVENGVRFANKILTHHRMHWHWSTIAHLKANMPSRVSLNLQYEFLRPGDFTPTVSIQ